MMLPLILAWVQQQDTAWTSDEVRTWLLGIMTTVVGMILRVMWTLRDDVREVKQEIPSLRASLHEHEEKTSQQIAMHSKEIRWLTAKRIAQEAVEESERQNYQGPDRRHHLRRDRDIVNEALAAELPYPMEE